MKKTIYYVSGTHWDREWYQTFQGFRINLVRMLDGLIETLEADPAFRVFHFDGQTIPLDDYLEVRPGMRERLCRLIERGRILIGPWYCMPDEFLVSGESYIRNLQIGHALAESYGARPWKNGYICDTFGHTAQTPQIFAGFGIDRIVLSRGTNEFSCPAFFHWEAPDGTRALTYKAPETCGYGQFAMQVVGMENKGQCADPHSEEFRNKARVYLDHEFTRTEVPLAVAMDAMDHEGAHRKTPAYMEEIRALYPDAEVVHTDFNAAFDRAGAYADRLPVKRGELVDPGRMPGPHIYVITHTLSSRHHIKQANDRAQALMERWIEPLFTLFAAKERPFPASYLDIMWKLLLQNHPHDSLCGCAVDRVHRDMAYRFSQVESFYEALLEDYERELAGGLFRLPPEGGYLTVLSPLPYEGTRTVSAVVAFSPEFPTWHEPFGYQDIAAFRLYDPEGREVPYVIEKIQTDVRVRTRSEEVAPCDLYTVRFQAAPAPLGLLSLRVEPSGAPVRFAGTMWTGDSLDNGLVRATLLPDGTVRLLDYATGRSYERLLRLADDGEIGDGWHSVRPAVDRVGLWAGVESVEVTASSGVYSELTVRRVLRLPERVGEGAHGLERDRHVREVPVRMVLGLERGERSLSVRLSVDNTVCDHRLRAAFPTGIAGGRYAASEAFTFVERDCGADETTYDWKEKQPLERATSGIVLKRDADGTGLAVVSEGGVHECGGDSGEDGALYLTLLRGFYKTHTTNGEPGGEELGEHTYALRLVPLDASVSDAALQRRQDWMTAGTRAFVTREPLSSSLLTLRGDAACSAVKPAQDRGGDIVVRVYNPGGREESVELAAAFNFKKAYLCDLLEQPCGDPLPAENGVLSLRLGPQKIVTLRFCRTA